MRVERHNQLRRQDSRPDAKVDAILSDHPAQKQVESLAGATARRFRKEIGHAWSRRDAAVYLLEIQLARASRKRVEARFDCFGAWREAVRKKCFDRAM